MSEKPACVVCVFYERDLEDCIKTGPLPPQHHRGLTTLFSQASCFLCVTIDLRAIGKDIFIKRPNCVWLAPKSVVGSLKDLDLTMSFKTEGSKARPFVPRRTYHLDSEVTILIVDVTDRPDCNV